MTLEQQEIAIYRQVFETILSDEKYMWTTDVLHDLVTKAIEMAAAIKQEDKNAKGDPAV